MTGTLQSISIFSTFWTFILEAFPQYTHTHMMSNMCVWFKYLNCYLIGFGNVCRNFRSLYLSFSLATYIHTCVVGEITEVHVERIVRLSLEGRRWKRNNNKDDVMVTAVAGEVKREGNCEWLKKIYCLRERRIWKMHANLLREKRNFLQVGARLTNATHIQLGEGLPPRRMRL